MNNAYIPDIGDIVWLHFTPQTGHEQSGHRPAIVLSPKEYNKLTSLMLCCPMTSHIKGYPFEVVIEKNKPSVILCDQVKSLDWIERKAQKKGKISELHLKEVKNKIRILLQI